MVEGKSRMETQSQQQIEPESSSAGGSSNGKQRTFPEPSLTLVEFSEALGILIAARTERDASNRRVILKKVGYMRLEPEGWGGTAYPEIHLQQNDAGLFVAVEPRTGKVLRHPSLRRYEVAFISKELFDCAISCLKEHRAEPLYELIAVTFNGRDGFSVDAGCLVAPDDYAAERHAINVDEYLPVPPHFSSSQSAA
jgi:hypothetical protein